MLVRRLTAVLALSVVLVLSGIAPPVWADDVDGDDVDDAIDVCINTPPNTVVDAVGRPLGDVDLDCDSDLEDYALSLRGFTGRLAPLLRVIETVPVGNAGNESDTVGLDFGRVEYVYNIGKYEVTAGQYTAFLNSVAADDTYGLYNAMMWTDSFGCKIERTGSSGSYSYSVASDWANRPVNYVSWGDAARFSNWLHNGRLPGAQDLTTTEDGSYFLDGSTSDAALLAVVRELNARWVIPSEDEWHKAAYHRNDGATGNYLIYPISSDSAPSNDLVDPDPGNNATFSDTGFTIGSPYYRTEVGAHQNSDSPYGTFDQGGNVLEWNEGVLLGPERSFRGGSFRGSVGNLRSRAFGCWVPTGEGFDIGFRVAEVP